MQRNQLIGWLLIMGLILAMSVLNRPSKEELKQLQTQDSIRKAQILDSTRIEAGDTAIILDNVATPSFTSDSLQMERLKSDFGPFAGAASGAEETHIIQNDKLKVTFNSKGGLITEVFLKEFHRLQEHRGAEDTQEPLVLLDAPKNKWEYILDDRGRKIKTSELYFAAKASNNSITYRADLGQGRYIEQVYSLKEGSYLIDYEVNFAGLRQNIIDGKAQLYWENHLQCIEKNDNYERNMYSGAYYRQTDGDVDRTGVRRSKEEELEGKQIQWLSTAQQFFNTTLLSEEPFEIKEIETVVYDKDASELKTFKTHIDLPVGEGSVQSFAFQLYNGPNDFELLKETAPDLQEVVPFGIGLFGTINRWVIRPLFNVLLGLFSSKGLVIIILTLLVKAILYPLTYRMLHSQAKMSALKPELAKLKEKFGDDQQKVQMESMKMYREYGVSPLGGCLPMVAQMPIWIALYRFFPASIEFRQSSFLWSNDLSSYDAFFQLPFELPFGMGAHISLFTLLWAITTVMYTYYNTKHMDLTANPAMKWMQYLMPIMFLGFFNSYASGLTCYLLFSNIFNIVQTVGTKQFIFDDDKILAELNKKKEKPKKKGGFQDRLQKALAEQQRVAEQRQKQKSK